VSARERVLFISEGSPVLPLLAQGLSRRLPEIELETYSTAIKSGGTIDEAVLLVLKALDAQPTAAMSLAELKDLPVPFDYVISLDEHLSDSTWLPSVTSQTVRADWGLVDPSRIDAPIEEKVHCLLHAASDIQARLERFRAYRTDPKWSSMAAREKESILSTIDAETTRASVVSLCDRLKISLPGFESTPAEVASLSEPEPSNDDATPTETRADGQPSTLPLKKQLKAALKIIRTAIRHPLTPHRLVVDPRTGEVSLDPLHDKTGETESSKRQ
jgi:hypothetical protein